MQGRFSEIGLSRPRKRTQREAFLDQMAAVVPWEGFEQLICPHYPVAGRALRANADETLTHRKFTLGGAGEIRSWLCRASQTTMPPQPLALKPRKAVGRRWVCPAWALDWR